MIPGRIMRALVAGGMALSAAGVCLSPTPAAARVHVGIGIGVPLFAPAYPAPSYYYAPYYYAPPAYYYPPPAYAPPAYAPAPSAAPSATASQCREYTSTQIIGGRPQQLVGTACLQPDGSWRIMD